MPAHNLQCVMVSNGKCRSRRTGENTKQPYEIRCKGTLYLASNGRRCRDVGRVPSHVCRVILTVVSTAETATQTIAPASTLICLRCLKAFQRGWAASRNMFIAVVGVGSKMTGEVFKTFAGGSFGGFRGSCRTSRTAGWCNNAIRERAVLTTCHQTWCRKFL